MMPLILHPTELSQWHAMVNEAQVDSRLILNEATESYLVYLLMRYTQGSNLIESILALDFLKSMQKKGRYQIELLKEVGDKSLLFCGLFPGMAQRRRVSLSYFSDLGQSAYLTLSELQEKQTGILYYQLSERFLDLQTVLTAMRTRF